MPPYYRRLSVDCRKPVLSNFWFRYSYPDMRSCRNWICKGQRNGLCHKRYSLVSNVDDSEGRGLSLLDSPFSRAYTSFSSRRALLAILRCDTNSRDPRNPLKKFAKGRDISINRLENGQNASSPVQIKNDAIVFVKTL